MDTKQKIAIIALGKRNAGKSNTWYQIFGRKIRSGSKQLTFNGMKFKVEVKNGSFEETEDDIATYFNVFVINGSNEETGKQVEDHLDVDNLPTIVFCSVQYIKEGQKTIDWFRDHGYFLYIQWINPGYSHSAYADYLEMEKRYSASGIFSQWSGKEKEDRATDILLFLCRWLRKNKVA